MLDLLFIMIVIISSLSTLCIGQGNFVIPSKLYKKHLNFCEKYDIIVMDLQIIKIILRIMVDIRYVRQKRMSWSQVGYL